MDWYAVANIALGLSCMIATGRYVHSVHTLKREQDRMRRLDRHLDEAVDIIKRQAFEIHSLHVANRDLARQVKMVMDLRGDMQSLRNQAER